MEGIVMNKVLQRRLRGQVVFELVNHFMLVESALFCFHSATKDISKIKSTNRLTACFERKVVDGSHAVPDFWLNLFTQVKNLYSGSENAHTQLLLTNDW